MEGQEASTLQTNQSVDSQKRFPNLLNEFYNQAKNNLYESHGRLGNLRQRLFPKAALMLLSDFLLIPMKFQGPTKFIKVGLFVTAGGKSMKSDFLQELNTIDSGEHMSVSIGKFRRELVLPNGEELGKNDIVGRIDFIRNIPQMDKETPLVGFVRALFKSADSSLNELAKLCRDNDPRLKDIQYFYGISHLAGPLAEKLGFTTIELQDEEERKEQTKVAFRIAKMKAGKNDEWKKFTGNFKEPKIAVISRKELLEAYSSSEEI
jgi:hypothetical protein